MSKLIIYLTLLTILWPVPSFAIWMKLFKDGLVTYYVDFETLKKKDGDIYFWELQDFVKPNEWGTWSAKVYNHGDCVLGRVRVVVFFYHNKPMGKGDVYIDDSPNDWRYPPPGSSAETILKAVCENAERL